MRPLLPLLAAAVCATAPAPLRADPPSLPAGFRPVFNGADLAGWRGWAIHSKGGTPAELAKLKPEERAKKFAAWSDDARQHWSVENGELVNDGKGAYLATEEEFGDYELVIDYKTVARADSGIYLKAAPQVQIWDSTEEAKFPLGADKGSGGLFNNAGAGKDPLVKADKPFGEWNQFRILQVGGRTTVHLNGQLVVDHAPLDNYFDRARPLPVKGPIVLQTHGGEIRWRNVGVRELSATEANEVLLKRGADGFEPAFNGTDLAGWKGATDNYEVADGAIVCKPGAGGNLFTAAQYGDFAARVEYKLPPGGNNGLAIRYPGSGDAAYGGACEIQILDDTHAKYAKLDPRQYNGSAYGMLPAVRGYLRPVGEWNLMEVTAVGPRLKVELNGNVILDAELPKVAEFMASSPHPGKDRASGHFGFAGHGDPVAFRNVRIKKLGPAARQERCFSRRSSRPACRRPSGSSYSRPSCRRRRSRSTPESWHSTPRRRWCRSGNSRPRSSRPCRRPSSGCSSRPPCRSWCSRANTSRRPSSRRGSASSCRRWRRRSCR